MYAIVKEAFPNASIVIDCFHMIKRLCDGLDEMRMRFKRKAGTETRKEEREFNRKKARAYYRKMHPRKRGEKRERPKLRSNLVLAFISGQAFYSILLVLQVLFYLIAWIGYKMEQRQIHNKFLFVPYYFMFMNINVMRGVLYIAANKGNGAWDKAKRA